MFGILQKMDRFSNNLMGDEERLSFLQEITDNGMVFDMHPKYQNAALVEIARGKLRAPLCVGSIRTIPLTRLLLQHSNTVP
jgi:hypothetical protein